MTASVPLRGGIAWSKCRRVLYSILLVDFANTPSLRVATARPKIVHAGNIRTCIPDRYDETGILHRKHRSYRYPAFARFRAGFQTGFQTGFQRDRLRLSQVAETSVLLYLRGNGHLHGRFLLPVADSDAARSGILASERRHPHYLQTVVDGHGSAYANSQAANRFPTAGQSHPHDAGASSRIGR